MRLAAPPQEYDPREQAELRRELVQTIARLEEKVSTHKVSPKVEDMLLSFDENNELHITVRCNADTVSFRYAVDTVTYPDAATVRAATVQTGNTGDFVETGPFPTSGYVYVCVFPYAGVDGDGTEGPLFQQTIASHVPIYNQCSAYIISQTDTSVTVQVDATNPGGEIPTVTLIGMSGTITKTSGAAIATPVASGSQWVFARGGASKQAGTVQFRANATGAVDDDDYLEIPADRDTTYIVTRARVISSTSTSVVVRVAVADPYPQGTNSATITYQSVGVGSVTPASGQTVTPAATLTEAAGTYVDFTIARAEMYPSSATGDGRVTFTATAANRVSDSDAVDVPVTESVATPIVTLSIRSNNSTSDATAKADMVVALPSDCYDFKWYASTSGFPSQYTTVMSGTVASGTSPIAVTDLGVSLALGDTVYVGVQPRHASGGYDSAQFVTVRLTRSSLSMAKVAYYPAPGTLTDMNTDTVHVTDYGDNEDWLGHEADPALGYYLSGYRTLFGSLALPSGATITKVEAELYNNGRAGNVDAYAVAAGSAIGSAFASFSSSATGGWATYNATCSQTTTSVRILVRVKLQNVSGGGNPSTARVRGIAIYYTPASLVNTI